MAVKRRINGESGGNEFTTDQKVWSIASNSSSTAVQRLTVLKSLCNDAIETYGFGHAVKTDQMNSESCLEH